jgi:hypothetical protein
MKHQALKDGSQAQRILGWLVKGHVLTPLNALRLFGTLRLGARIYELKRRGHPIISNRIKSRSGAIVAAYSYASR